MLSSGHYEDRVSGKRFGRALLPSDILRDNVLRILIPHIIGNESDAFIDDCKERFEDTASDSDEFKLTCLNDLYLLAVNDSTYAETGLFQYNRDLDINGMVYWLDLSELPRGTHTLTTSRQIIRPDTSYVARQAIIEFFKEAPALN